MSAYTEKMARQAISRLEEEIMQELDAAAHDPKKAGIALHLLATSRAEAAEALDIMARGIDLHADGALLELSKLQGHISRHLDLIRWISQVVTAGREAFSSQNVETQFDLVKEILPLDQTFEQAYPEDDL